jgi:hypothetical protein
MSENERDWSRARQSNVRRTGKDGVDWLTGGRCTQWRHIEFFSFFICRCTLKKTPESNSITFILTTTLQTKDDWRSRSRVIPLFKKKCVECSPSPKKLSWHRINICMLRIQKYTSKYPVSLGSLQTKNMFICMTSSDLHCLDVVQCGAKVSRQSTEHTPIYLLACFLSKEFLYLLINDECVYKLTEILINFFLGLSRLGF